MLASRPYVTIIQLPIIEEKRPDKANKEQRHDSYETGLGHYTPSDNVLDSETENKEIVPIRVKQRCMLITKVEAQTSLVFPLSTTLTSLLQKFLDLIFLHLLSSFPKQARQTIASPPPFFHPPRNNPPLRQTTMQSLLVSELLLSECPTKTALHLIATNDTRRCTSCYTWFINLPSVAETRSFLSSSLHADLQRWIAGRARDTCPTCQGEKAALAHIRDPRQHQSIEIQAAADASTRRYRARRDVDLYQALRAFGSTLSALPPRAYSDINSLLNWRQERALFHALRDLGAFRYPGMAEGCFCDGLGGAVSDEKRYEIIRLRDIRWNMYRGWVKDGLRVSFEVPSDEEWSDEKSTFEEPNVEEPQKDHALVAHGRAAKRWRGRGMYRKWAPRMDRSEFELEPIAEGDEMEAALDEMWSYRILNRTGSGLMGEESKPAKNFSRPFGIPEEERPMRAVVGCAEAISQVQRVTVCVSRREVLGSSGGRRRLMKAGPY